jgi:hypothetical protein
LTREICTLKKLCDLFHGNRFEGQYSYAIYAIG